MNAADEGRVLVSTHNLERAGELREAFQSAGYNVELVTPDEDVSGGPPIELLVVTGSPASAVARSLVGRAGAESKILKQIHEEILYSVRSAVMGSMPMARRAGM